MIGDEASPGRFASLLGRAPEGSVLRGVFVGLLTLSVALVVVDFRDAASRAADTARRERTTPLPMKRPEPGDQVRPYLPKTIPVGPDRGLPQIPGYDGPVDGAGMAEPMRFFEAPGGVVSAVGMIVPGTANAFETFLDGTTAGGVRKIVLHSPGGSVVDAIEMAQSIRRNGLSTRVPEDGYCASACPLVFAGGVTRLAGENAWVGVHQVYTVPETGASQTLDRSIADVQETLAHCQELLKGMGVDPIVWIKAMQTPAASLYVLTRRELIDWRLVRPLPDGPDFIGPPAPLSTAMVPSVATSVDDAAKA